LSPILAVVCLCSFRIIFGGCFILGFDGKDVPTKIVVPTKRVVVFVFAARERHAFRHKDSLFGTLAIQDILFAKLFVRYILHGVFRVLHLLLFDLVHLFHHTLNEHFRSLPQTNIGDDVVGTNTIHAGEGATKTILSQRITNTRFTDGSPFGVPG
jgi:hypothetical protein